VDLLQGARDLGLAAVAVVGALWALWRLWVERAFETALGIDVKAKVQPLEKAAFVFLEVVLTNHSKRKLEAKRVKEGQPAFKDEEEELQHSCGLKIRKVADSATSGSNHVSWFNEACFQPLPGIPEEINLLEEYEDTETGEIDEWLEPRESRHLGLAVVLTPGEYLMKVTFVGNRRDTDFWSRIVHLHVGGPAASPEAEARLAEGGAVPKQPPRGLSVACALWGQRVAISEAEAGGPFKCPHCSGTFTLCRPGT
jgi:hypothetical protein